MKKLGFGIALLLFCWSCGKVQFNEVLLYDEYQVSAPISGVEQIIYREDVGTLWSSLAECGTFQVSDQFAYEGQKSIKIQWDKSSCEWIGFGNSFNNWNPEDLTEKRFRKALSFRVRTQKGKVKTVPIVANLEDFEGGGSYHFVGKTEYINGLYIDTNWTEIVVPLWHFPVSSESINLHRIKQMKFQLEGQGAFYLDEIKVIDYTQKDFEFMQSYKESLRPKGSKKQQIYPVENFDFAIWGIKNGPCQYLQQVSDAEYAQQISWESKTEGCKNSRWGINWNNWYPINFRGMDESAKICIGIKVLESMNLTVRLRDFKNQSMTLYQSELAEGEVFLDLPVGQLLKENSKLQLDRIRELYFETSSHGKIRITSINLQ